MISCQDCGLAVIGGAPEKPGRFRRTERVGERPRHGARGFLVRLLRFEADLNRRTHPLADLHGPQIEVLQPRQHCGVGPGGEGVKQVESTLRTSQRSLTLAQACFGYRRLECSLRPALTGGVGRENLQNPGPEAIRGGVWHEEKLSLPGLSSNGQRRGLLLSARLRFRTEPRREQRTRPVGCLAFGLRETGPGTDFRSR